MQATSITKSSESFIGKSLKNFYQTLFQFCGFFNYVFGFPFFTWSCIDFGMIVVWFTHSKIHGVNSYVNCFNVDDFYNSDFWGKCLLVHVLCRMLC